MKSRYGLFPISNRIVYNGYTRGGSMSGFRTVIALIIVVIIVLVGVFYNDIRGYDKIERINEWVLYYCEDCDLEETEYDGYILINGFAEMSVDEALEIEYFNNDLEQEIILLIEEYE